MRSTIVRITAPGVKEDVSWLPTATTELKGVVMREADVGRLNHMAKASLSEGRSKELLH